MDRRLVNVHVVIGLCLDLGTLQRETSQTSEGSCGHFGLSFSENYLGKRQTFVILNPFLSCIGGRMSASLRLFGPTIKQAKIRWRCRAWIRARVDLKSVGGTF